MNRLGDVGGGGLVSLPLDPELLFNYSLLPGDEESPNVTATATTSAAGRRESEFVSGDAGGNAAGYLSRGEVGPAAGGDIFVLQGVNSSSNKERHSRVPSVPGTPTFNFPSIRDDLGNTRFTSSFATTTNTTNTTTTGGGGGGGGGADSTDIGTSGGGGAEIHTSHSFAGSALGEGDNGRRGMVRLAHCKPWQPPLGPIPDALQPAPGSAVILQQLGILSNVIRQAKAERTLKRIRERHRGEDVAKDPFADPLLLARVCALLDSMKFPLKARRFVLFTLFKVTGGAGVVGSGGDNDSWGAERWFAPGSVFWASLDAERRQEWAGRGLG